MLACDDILLVSPLRMSFRPFKACGQKGCLSDWSRTCLWASTSLEVCCGKLYDRLASVRCGWQHRLRVWTRLFVEHLGPNHDGIRATTGLADCFSLSAAALLARVRPRHLRLLALTHPLETSSCRCPHQAGVGLGGQYCFCRRALPNGCVRSCSPTRRPDVRMRSRLKWPSQRPSPAHGPWAGSPIPRRG